MEIIINEETSKLYEEATKDIKLIQSNITIKMNYIPEWLSTKKILGNFNCSFNELTSLENCPQYIRGTFSCNYNKLSSLKGGPIYVKGYYCCHNNKLTSLEHIAEYIGKYIFAGELNKNKN